jgi:hypothetical protein
MKSREDVNETLKMILDRYDTNRCFLKYDKERAILRTLESYDDFYDWVYEIKEE